MIDEAIEFLEGWYATQHDGEWELEHGVTICNVSNPGWALSVDLVGTDLEGRVLEDWTPVDLPDDWLYCHSDGRRFEALSSSPGLVRIIDGFRRFAVGEIGYTSHQPPETAGPSRAPSMPGIRYVDR
jgi:hypothetical protein